MASWTAPIIHATGDVLAVTDWNGLANDATFLYQAPYIMAYNSVSTGLVTNTATQVTLGGLTASGYGWSVSSNNLVVPLTGVYQLSGNVYYAANSGAPTDNFWSYVYHNGSQTLQGAGVSTTPNSVGSPVTGLIAASAGDTFGLWAFAAQAGATTGTGATVTFLHAIFIGSQ